MRVWCIERDGKLSEGKDLLDDEGAGIGEDDVDEVEVAISISSPVP